MKPKRLVACVAALLTVSSIWLVLAMGGNSRSEILRAEKLDPVTTARGITGRRLVRFGDSECVILNHPLVFIASTEVLNNLHDKSETLSHYELAETSRWYVSPENPERLTTFNCATFAVGDVIDLSTCDWLEISVSCNTDHRCPVSIVLDHFYDQKSDCPLSAVDWGGLESSAMIHDGDVLAMVERDATNEVVYSHLGAIEKRNNRNLLVSKLGKGPIVRGSIRRTAMEFEGQFNELRIYRRRQSN